MTALLLRQPRTLCFFCQSLVSPQPQRPLAFLCPHCGCWNRYDANGDILSDDPAMHDESLNRKSFARRGVDSQLSVLVTSLSCCASASPRKDRLLTTFGSAPFCSTCQSNQRLIVSLLSSYLPPSDGVRPRSLSHFTCSLSHCHVLVFRTRTTNLVSLASRPTKHLCTHGLLYVRSVPRL